MNRKKEPLRVYADTSVFGGVFDLEFATPSQIFFTQVRSGRFQLVTSAIVQEELELAPPEIQEFFDDMLELAKFADISAETLALQQAYLQTKIVTPKWAADALHVAIATVAECALVVSWNFKHIVHFEKIPLYNAVNTLQGYRNIAIYSPQEVIAYGENEEI